VLLLDKQPKNLGRRIRERLAEALQAVHQRAEVHITARELRATLSYILFGIHYCADLHERPELQPHGYWDLAFDLLLLFGKARCFGNSHSSTQRWKRIR
jgi:hypothetical protein